MLTRVEGLTARIEKEKAKRIADRNARKDVKASKVMATEQKEARKLAKEVNSKLAKVEACAKEFQKWAKSQACFAAGTMLLTPDGHKRIEEFMAGEQILSRSECDVNGPLEVRVVEKVLRRWGRIWELRVGGRVIRTTGEHPFYERMKGWVAAELLEEGDWLAGRDGRWVRVEGIVDTGKEEVVYNLTVSNDHTYFVGCDEAGFSVWAHNACVEFRKVEAGE